MSVRSARLPGWLGLLIAGLVTTTTLVSTASAAPRLDRQLEPGLPDQLEVGDVLYASLLVDPDDTTFDHALIRIVAPDGVVIHEERIEDASLRATIDWIVPSDATPGFYGIQFEYWSVESGLTTYVQEPVLLRVPNGICVFKFSDLNADGIFDAETEPLLSGWEICLGDDCRVTDDNGVICWLSLPAGPYEFCETQQEGWRCTTCDDPPSGTCISFELEDATSVGKILFGNHFMTVPTDSRSWGRIKSEYR